jgi:hypothetical protein
MISPDNAPPSEKAGTLLLKADGCWPHHRIGASLMSVNDLQAELDRLRAENARLKQRTTYLKVSDKGAVSLYGLGRFPVTLYAEQWEAILDMGSEIRTFMADNVDKIKRLPKS